MNTTKIICGFPATGKTWCYTHLQDKFLMLDTDSISYRGLIDGDGEYSGIKNPEFPNNYVDYIKENMGKVDFIFISADLEIRKALTENEISFIMVYPRVDQLDNWIYRMEKAGYDDVITSYIGDNWAELVCNQFVERKFLGERIFALSDDRYLDEPFLSMLKEELSLH